MKRQQLFLIAALVTALLAAAGIRYALTRAKEAAAPTTAAGAQKERKVIYWADPMTPGFRSDKPGKSPFMDMDLVPVYEDEGANVVTLRPEIVQNLGVRTHKAARGAPPRRIVTTGYLFRDAQGSASVAGGRTPGATDARGLAALVDLFDREASAVRPGQIAEVRILDSPTLYHGVIESIESDIDIGARAFKARIRMTHADIVLRPNMLAEVAILATAAGRQAIYIPREALIRTGSRNAVVLALGAGRFQPVEVVPGIETDDWVEIQRGVREGDTVVTSGQFLIDSEANVRASFQRMEPAPPPETKGGATPTPQGQPAAAPHGGH